MPRRRRSSSPSARPADTGDPQALALSDGMWQEAPAIGAGIVGGDLVSAPQWVISVTALGDLGGRAPVLPSGASPGDTVAVVGELGRSAAGYALWHSDIDEFDELRRRHLVPRVPYGAGAGRRRRRRHRDDRCLRRAVRRPRPHRRRVGCRHRRVAVTRCPPIRTPSPRAAAAVGADAWAWVLGGGEDHALVATFPARRPGGLADDRHGGRRAAAGPGRRRRRGTEIRAGSRSERGRTLG